MGINEIGTADYPVTGYLDELSTGGIDKNLCAAYNLLAGELKCSTQPVFHAFRNTWEVRQMKRKNMSYDNRYKYKLNMLEPGLIMMKLIGVLFVAGILFWVVGWHWISLITWFLSGAVFAVLLILLAIEAHQDKVLNDIAMRENNE